MKRNKLSEAIKKEKRRLRLRSNISNTKDNLYIAYQNGIINRDTYIENLNLQNEKLTQLIP